MRPIRSDAIRRHGSSENAYADEPRNDIRSKRATRIFAAAPSITSQPCEKPTPAMRKGTGQPIASWSRVMSSAIAATCAIGVWAPQPNQTAVGPAK